MGSIISPKTDRDVLMSRLGSWLAEDRYGVALLALEEFLKAEPQDRECRLLWLLCNIKVHGLQSYEYEIEKVKSFYNLDCSEKAIIKRILLVAILQARLEQREDQVVGYQRLVRRLVRGSSLLDPCSMAEKIMELRYRTHAWILRFLTSHESVPTKRWRLAGLLALVLVSISLVQNKAESPKNHLPPKVLAIRRVAAETAVLGALPIAREIQPASNDGKSSPAQRAMERKDNTIKQASSLNKEAKYRGVPTPKVKGSPSRVARSNRASAAQKLSPRKRDTNPRQTSVDPMSLSETEPAHLAIYRARVPIQVRKAGDFSAPVLATVAAGAELSVLGSRDDWFKVRTHGEGKVGYVRKEFVVQAESSQ
jgi:hypothetical protein